jgi:asparagine synthase (glutamine-hydrolysing)
MVWQLDEPQADLAPLNVGLISRSARAAGIKVLLSGAGGDDIFSGYRRHQSLQLEPVWSWLPQPARGALRGLSRRVPTRHPAMRRAVKVFGQAHRTPDERIASYFYWLDPEQGDSLFAGDALRDARSGSGDALLDCVHKLPPSMPRLNKMLYLDTKYFLPDHNLNYTDKMSMAHGVEVRVPLLDYEVVRHAGRLRVEDKQRGQRQSGCSERRWKAFCRETSSTGPRPDLAFRFGSGCRTHCGPSSMTFCRSTPSRRAESFRRRRCVA